MENTISTVSGDAVSHAAGARADDEILLLIECDRPDAGSSRHRLDQVNEIVIGRGTSRLVGRSEGQLLLRVPDARISTTHALIRRLDHAFYVEDAGAKNGVIVNGTRVRRQLLRDGDVIECGHTFFVFRMSRRRSLGAVPDLELAANSVGFQGLLTFHEGLNEQLRALADIARSSIPVLVQGPSGTGKELIARALHALSQRKGAFVGVNCGALPENLIEVELFGARRGAFTGASEDRTGLIRSSDAGTLFLDEIGDFPLPAQPALLRTLQEREVMPVGATRPTAIDLRLVAATHHNLDELVGAQKFRADLFARISGFVVRLPPLRERIDDLGFLIALLLRRHRSIDQPMTTISPDAMRLLLRHPWPLNIRELELCLRAALALASSRIEVAHLPESIRNPTATLTPVAAFSAPKRPLTAEQMAIRDQVRGLLVEHGGNISQVARVMGKDRVQIRRWIRLFGLTVNET